MFGKKYKEQQIPCVACASVRIPLFLRNELSYVDYGMIPYEPVRKHIVDVLEKDLAHPECREFFLKKCDEDYDYQEDNEHDEH